MVLGDLTPLKWKMTQEAVFCVVFLCVFNSTPPFS